MSMECNIKILHECELGIWDGKSHFKRPKPETVVSILETTERETNMNELEELDSAVVVSVYGNGAYEFEIFDSKGKEKGFTVTLVDQALRKEDVRETNGSEWEDIYREMTVKTGEENDWNFDDLVDDSVEFISNLLQEDRKQFARELIGEDESEAWSPGRGAANNDLVYNTTLNPRQQRNIFRESLRKKAGIEK